MPFLTKNSKAAKNSSSVTKFSDHQLAVFFIQLGISCAELSDFNDSGIVIMFSEIRYSIPLINTVSEILFADHH